MTPRPISMGAPFRWFMKALDAGKKNPKALFGGIALVLLIGLVPSVLQMGIELLVKPAMPVLIGVYVLAMLLGLVLTPPLMGGALRLMDACEAGRPASAGDVLQGFRDHPFAIRMILVGLLMTLVYVLVLGGLYAAMPGKDFMIELFSRSAGLEPGAQPDLTGMPPFPPSFLLWFLAAMAVFTVMAHAYFLAFAQAALGDQRPVAAVGQGFAAVFRNALPFIGFTLVAIIVGFVLAMILAIIAGLVIGLLAVVLPALALVVAIPLYLGLMLVMYVVMIGFYYHAWRDIFGAPPAPPVQDVVAA